LEARVGLGVGVGLRLIGHWFAVSQRIRLGRSGRDGQAGSS
jgi:hypothetical protein